MSPGNSYFKEDVIEKLLKTCVEKYGKAVVFIADIPAISTYVALGYPENRAWRDKALPQSNMLKNRTKRVLAKLGYSENQVKIIDWATEVENNKDYLEKYNSLENFYKTNTAFRELADTTTEEVLKNSSRGAMGLAASVKVAVHYLLSEIAFLEFAPNYLKTDIVMYVYHRAWPIYERYTAGDFDQIPKPQLAFQIL
ncbi:MAG: tRNA-dependent cyclodipeptide synthase [Patescibacteria group bacterium]